MPNLKNIENRLDRLGIYVYCIYNINMVAE